jgi:lysophospholipase L1-like esterase
VQKRLRYSEVLNFGIPGLRTRELLDRLVEAFDGSEEGDLHLGLLTADVIVLDIGRNDRWLYGTPKATYRNIKRAATMIRTRVAEETGMTPMVITAVLMLPNRGSQGPWVKELNDYILRGHRSTAPADLRFDLVSKRLLSADQIHPSSAGYDELARTLLKYLLRSLPPKMLALRPYADEHALH